VETSDFASPRIVPRTQVATSYGQPPRDLAGNDPISYAFCLLYVNLSFSSFPSYLFHWNVDALPYPSLFSLYDALLVLAVEVQVQKGASALKILLL